MRCPICSNKAVSQHHIKPRAEGGTDDPRNLVWLCKKCHDEVEDSEFTIQLLERKRKEKLGQKTVSSEEYWYIQRPEGVLFVGIKKPGKRVENYNIFFPYKKRGGIIYQQMPLDTGVFPGKIRIERGRPHLVVDKDLVRRFKQQNLSNRQIAKQLGISHMSVNRILEKACSAS